MRQSILTLPVGGIPGQGEELALAVADATAVVSKSWISKVQWISLLKKFICCSQYLPRTVKLSYTSSVTEEVAYFKRDIA